MTHFDFIIRGTAGKSVKANVHKIRQPTILTAIYFVFIGPCGGITSVCKVVGLFGMLKVPYDTPKVQDTCTVRQAKLN